MHSSVVGANLITHNGRVNGFCLKEKKNPAYLERVDVSKMDNQGKEGLRYQSVN